MDDELSVVDGKEVAVNIDEVLVDVDGFVLEVILELEV